MLDQFRRDGYVVVKNLVPVAELDALVADIAAVFGRRARALGLTVPAPSDHDSLSQLLVALFRKDVSSYVASAKQTQHLSNVHRLGLGSEISGVLQALELAMPALSTRPVIHYMSDDLKIEGGYHKTPIHQDWRSVQGSLDGLTIWLPLFAVGAADYPLEIIPGSHRRGLLPSVDDAFGHRVADGLIDESEFVALPMARGDAVFFSGFLVHRTGTKGGSKVRIALSYRYNNAAEASFVARNYPGPYIYRPDMRLLHDGFPSTQELAQFFPPLPDR
jgi:ectoine hydroxylase-related dioxygenase (phytanoyl-CoA dioxygenase family)